MSTQDESSLIEGLESLYHQISFPTFEPTVIFETKLAVNFQAILIKANEKSSHEHFAVLVGYLRCIIALLQKDGKFLACYFEKMDERHGAAIVNILRNKPEYLGDNLSTFLNFLVELIKLPTQKTIISALDIHHAVTANIQCDPDIVASCLEIIEKFSDNIQITQELRNMKTVDWICGNVENIAVNYSTHPLCWNIVTSLLGLAVNVVEGNPNSFKLYLDNLHRADQLCPRACSKQVKELQHQLSVVLQQSTSTRARPSLAKTDLSPSNEKKPKSRKVFEVSIDQLKTTVSKDSDLRDNFIYPTRKYGEPVQRNSYIDNLDPSLNVCIGAKSVGEICLDTLAEVVCGMLNSNKGGFIHIGITSFYRVLGLYMNRDARDEFRITLSRLFSQCISPLVSLHLISVEFIPVFQPADGAQEIKFWIVKISLPAKKGNTNVLLNLREVRETTIRLIEQRQIDLGAAPF